MSGYDITLDRNDRVPINLILDKIKDNAIILEFGPANGRMTKVLKEEFNSKVYIVERSEELFEKAIKYAEDGICSDIMEYEWLEKYKKVQFDYIIFTDILEHLPDPQEVLKKAAGLLKEDGIIYISVPNIAHNDVVLSLVSDKFVYNDTGLLDKTHIHFFTYESVISMVHDMGMSVCYEDYVTKPTLNTELLVDIKEIDPNLVNEIYKRNRGEVYQYVFGLTKSEQVQKQVEPEKTYVARRIYFDYGNGIDVENMLEFKNLKTDKMFSIKVKVPADVKIIRFDPIVNMPCIIDGFKAFTNLGDINITHCNGNAENGKLIFDSFNPQCYFTELEGVDWISVIGNVEYDVELGLDTEGKALRHKVKCLEEEVENYKNYQQDMEKTLNDTKRENGEYQEYIHKAEAALTELKQEKQDLILEREDLQNKNSELNQENQDLALEREDLQHKNSKLNQENQNLVSEKEDLQSANSALVKNREELQKENETLKETNKKINAEVESEKSANERIVDENQKLLETVAILKTKNEQVENENKILSDKLHEVFSSKSWRYTNALRKFYKKIKNNNDIEESSVISADADKRVESTMENTDCATLIEEERFEDCCWTGEVEMDTDDNPLVSVIVPNFNHSAYLRERLDSIYAQTYKNYEVILLDDCSSDTSREILDEYAEKHKENTITIYNDTNCGKVFKQWNKGIANAKGKYIWIAESDDYTSDDFLEKMVPLLAKESVMLAFARSVFVQDGQQTWTTEEYLSDLEGLKWDKPFTMTAKMIVEKGFSIKNIIPNVSSAVFRNVGILSEELQNIWGNMKLSGDWIFYLNMIKGGCISYTNETTNYYRVHSQSTSLKVQHTMDYYKEYEMVSKYIASNFIVPEKNYEIILHNLKEHYKAIHHTAEAEEVNQYYNIEEILKAAKERRPNIIMACFALCSGGGETYPLFLANELKRQGLCVTVLDFRMQEYNENIRRKLDPTVPLVEVESFDYFYKIVKQLGCEVIHSHHASIDEAVAVWINGSDLDCKQVITLHGMYETMEEEVQKHVLDMVDKTCRHFVYIADKNLVPFKQYGYYQPERFIKLPNGLPEMEVTPVQRESLGIGKDDFVVCLVSRGIAEKGWREAIEATVMANKKSPRKIHLLLIGDGDIRKELEKSAPEYVHFMGVRNNVRDYFAMADAGILPTTFKGESYPLVVIESLMCGKPVIATDIAEVKNQITDENGNLAGMLLNLNDWKLDIPEISEAILTMANNTAQYHQMQQRTTSASKKFNMEKVAQQYLDVYEM